MIFFVTVHKFDMKYEEEGPPPLQLVYAPVHSVSERLPYKLI